MTVFIAPAPRQQFFDSNGDPIASGLLFTYEAGTTTKAATYTTSVGDVANANPIVLDASGRTPSGLWLTDGQSYKFVLAPAGDTDPPASAIFTEDNIDGTNDFDAAGASQWIASGMSPTFVSSTQFTVTGDQTSTLDVGRRLELTVSAGTVYGAISVSAFTTLTTITLIMDSGDALDSGLSAFNYSVLSGTNHSVPKLTDAKWIANGVAVVGSANAFTGNDTHAGDEVHTGKITMTGKAIDEAVHTEAAHATTADIWTGGNTCLLSGGVVTFTDVADAPQAGAVRYVVANDAHVITDNAALEVDGNANYTCVSGDILRFEALTTTTFRVSVISRGDGTPVLGFATEAEVKTGTLTTKSPSVSTLRTGLWDYGTLWTSTSGTSNTWGSLPSWATEYKLILGGVSLSGTEVMKVQLGDSGGFHTTNYDQAGTRQSGAGNAVDASTDGFIIAVVTAANVVSGVLSISLIDPATFTYSVSGSFSAAGTTEAIYVGGSVTLDTVLTQVKLMSDSANTFDAGAANLKWQ
jgi:hypothetical protein